MRHEAPPRRPRAVVIGSGFGGLAAAVRLGARGYAVTVLEQLDVPGGRARVHRRDGFVFDAGPTIVTAPFLFEELWALCGRRLADDVQLVALDPFYRIRFDDGSVFTYNGDPQAMEREVARFSPHDVEGYRALMRDSEAIFRVGFEQLADAVFDSPVDMLRTAPGLLRFGGLRSVHTAVSRRISDERLRAVFGYHPLLIGGNPFRASAIYCLIAHLERQWGVHYVMGGIGRLVDGLVDLVRDAGHELRCGAQVDEILVEHGRAVGVRLAGGEVVPADVVVSNADSAWTYRRLLAKQSRRRWTDRRLDRSAYSMGLFVWYFGTRRRYDDVAHHTILMGPRYRGLLDDVFSHKVVADDCSIYLHRPSATDPAVAPAGCDAFYALSPVPNLEGGQDWAELAEPYRRRVARRLEETLLPGLSETVATSFVATPAEFERDLSSYRGAGFGLEPILTQSAWFRPHNRSEDVENLYLVGAGTHPGAGLPGVLSSARVLDKVVPDAVSFA